LENAAMKLTVFSPDGTQSREQEFDGLPVFEGDKGLQALKEVIVAIRANMRQGTHSTKTRGEVRGGGRKPWRQKGTGRARAGSIRSPLWPGGGVVFGPKPRDYSKKINGRVKSLAFSRALYDRAVAGEIAVIEAFAAAPAKTKAVHQVLGRIAPDGKILLVDAPFAAETLRAARNIARVSMQEAAKLNALDLARYRRIIVSARALDAIIARVSGGPAVSKRHEGGKN
jgi:large subunit ribosomal protein L4